MQQTRGKHSMFWRYASTKQGKRAIQNARVCAIWIIYALESATRFDRVVRGVIELRNPLNNNPEPACGFLRASGSDYVNLP